MELDNHMSALERHIQKLREDLKKKELEIESVKEKIQALLPVKIYTRKELKLMADKQKKKEDQKINYEKSHIDLITLDAMREADKIRDEAGSSESEKREAELKALTMEIQALEKDIKIKKIYLYFLVLELYLCYLNLLYKKYVKYDIIIFR